MSQSRLIELSYYDPKAEVRLTAYADTLVLDEGPTESTMTAIRFGGYPEMVNAMAAAIHGGAAIDATIRDESIRFQCIHKGYTKQLSHDGVYATATLMANDEAQEAINTEEQEDEETPEQPRTCYIFCPAGDRDRLFEELDRKTAAPLIPEFQEQILDALIADGSLHRMKVYALKSSMDAWALSLKPEDKNIVEVLERGLKDGSIRIPGADSSKTDEFSQVGTVTQYLNTFGVTVADRIRNQFDPLFDPASEPLSDEVLAVNEYIRSAAGYPLYDAQLAVAEAVRRKLRRGKVAIIRAECGSGKTKIGSTALGALYARRKTFNVVMCPSHITKKWVREIGETLPDTYGMVVKSPAEFDRLYGMYASGDKSVYAIMSKEKARDGYMRYPAVTWSNRQKGFLCPDCREPVQMEISDDGTKYFVNADQFFFLNENKKNHKCLNCGSVLWAPVSNTRKLPWIKISKYGWVYRHGAAQHLDRIKNETVRDQLLAIIDQPEALYPTRGAQRRFPLSTYVKKRYRGRVDALLCDELHEYNNDSGQGDAMAELYGAAIKFIGMTATLINGYSSGIFHLLYRIVPGLMLKDGKPYTKPGLFDGEYGVTETVYSIEDPEYNSNRRAARTGTKTRQLPGVSPLVFSRFLLEHTAFLGLEDMGKDLPDYEEIPVPLKLDDEVQDAYKDMEKQLTRVLRTDRRVARKILSTYLNLLTVYPDQPYDQPPVLHPIDGLPIVTPPDLADFDSCFAKEEKTLEIVREKVANGGRVIIYTSWTRTDSQDKLLKLLREEGIKTDVLLPRITPEKREEWVEKRVSAGLQVLITNPKCVETGLDLNAFTTLIFYSMGYNLFTLRQASRRSWRINQTAPRVEVYLLYYANTMQAKAMKLMASKLAVAGIIEGSFSDEGLAAMSDVKDMTSQMAKELMLGIRDNVEDIAAAYKRMAIINPDRRSRQEKVIIEEPAFPEEPAVNIPTPRQIVDVELLEKTEESKPKRSKKPAILEDQLSIFDLVA